jgi:hypothetical protein
METAAIGVEAPSKRQVGAFVSTKNVTGRIVKHLQLHMGSWLQEIPVP